MRRDCSVLGPGGQHKPPLLAPLESTRFVRTASSRGGRKGDAPGRLLFERAPEGSKRMLAAAATMHQESMLRLLAAERDDVRPQAGEPRPSTSAPVGRAGGTFTRAPPRDLLASRGAQFRISALDKPAEHESDECQRCADYRQQIKGLKRRLGSVRYADDHSREPRIDEARAERDQLKQVVADLQSRLERSGGETARRRELDCLKDDLREAKNQRCGEVEEKEACIAELQQIILNRDESIEVYKKEQQRLQENLRHVSHRLQGAEAAGAAASAALQEAQSQLQVQHAGSSSEKELLLHAQVCDSNPRMSPPLTPVSPVLPIALTNSLFCLALALLPLFLPTQMHELSAQLLDAEERLRVRSQDGAQALEEERHRRLTEAESLSSSIGRLERSMELLVKALKSASRRDEGHAAVVKQLKQVRA